MITQHSTFEFTFILLSHFGCELGITLYKNLE